MAKKSKTAEKSKNDNRLMKLSVIACRVFAPELGHLLEDCIDDVTVEFLPLRAHDAPDTLRADIQAAIDAVDSSVDAVILAYGLCGNATAGLRAGRVPLFVPQAHDCSQILLGGRAGHQEFFGSTPSRGWTSRGYLAEEGDPFRAGESASGWDYRQLVEQYGEENARYVWDTMHASDSAEDDILYFLDVPETTTQEVLEEARDRAAARGKTLVAVPATLVLLARLMSGRGGEEILVVPPGAEIHPTWDDRVIGRRYTAPSENPS